jgi:Ni/Co efflux regulator RcnB
MRRFLIAAAITAIAAAPLAGSAHPNDIQDVEDCRDSNDPATVELAVVDDPEDVDNADRGSVCVKDPNNDGRVLLYVGGEVQADNPGAETGVACGAVVVDDVARAGQDTQNFNHGTGHHHCQ